MNRHDDTDRFCRVCHGTRHLIDAATHDYAYSARQRVACWSCAAPSEPSPQIGAEALMDAACASMGITRAEWAAREFAEYHGGRA